MKSLEKLIKRSGTVRNDYETVENAQERSGTVNGQEHLGTIESERSNALERIVENVHVTVTLTRQKRKKHCNLRNHQI
jgi:tRNA (Thr-GGU) A37 N-methylase